jgi:enamine deaminase RidA (YjgF/YER057c/UK114 family)
MLSGAGIVKALKYVFNKLISLLKAAQAKREDVVRVKMYTTDMKNSLEISKAYSEFFKEIKPLCTLVGISALNRPSQLVEIELDAVIGSSLETLDKTPSIVG